MAGTSDPQAAPWPYGGDKGYYLLCLGPVDFLASQTDPAALTKIAMAKIPFDCTVEKAYLSLMESADNVFSSGMQISITTDDGTPQTIVSARALTTADDAGTPMELTVADKGPLLANGVVFLNFDPGDTDGEVHCMAVDLWLKPSYS